MKESISSSIYLRKINHTLLWVNSIFQNTVTYNKKQSNSKIFYISCGVIKRRGSHYLCGIEIQTSWRTQINICAGFSIVVSFSIMNFKFDAFTWIELHSIIMLFFSLADAIDDWPPIWKWMERIETEAKTSRICVYVRVCVDHFNINICIRW